jgi:hypothetical protein
VEASLSDWLTISGVAPWDGRYELNLDDQPLTTREWGWIKKHAGYLPLTLTADGWADPELVAVLAAIAARRADTIDNTDVARLIERFADAPFGTTITIETDKPAEVEADPGPPPRSSGPRPSSNGASSKTASEISADDPSPTGPPLSDTSPSVPTTSVS